MNKHLLSIHDVSAEDIVRILDTADSFREVGTRVIKKVPALRGRTVVNLFYENSTRTRISFELAAKRLSADVINFSTSGSSVSKGESLKDTALTLQAMGADAVVIRHSSSGSPLQLTKWIKGSVLNAGDGTHEHPTQALLDLYTIKDEIGRLDGINIALVGDLANGRTVRSLTYLLSKFRDTRIWFVAPPQVAMRDDIKAHLDEHGVRWTETGDLAAVLPQVDVVYQTRIQKERFTDEEAYRAVKGVYRIDAAALALMKRQAIVMHPLPRVDEIATEVDADPRAAYFRQARNGLFIRMALLDWLIS